MKKHITIPVLATVTLFLAIGIVVACTKENTTKETKATETPRSAKGLTLPQQLANGVYNVWQKSDSAYRANATSFLSACGDEDFETFYEMTNITSAQIDSISAWGIRLYNPLVQDITDYTPCIPCNTSLELYGNNVAAMRAVINELELYNDSDTVPDFMPYMDSCVALCYYQHPEYNDEEKATCLFNCNFRREHDRMERHLMAIKVDE